MVVQSIAQGTDVVLNLGAGLDTRPYRLPLPEKLIWIEADAPKLIADKKTVLSGESPRCRLEHVGLDLSEVDARRSLLLSISQRAQRVLVLTEGVIGYLSNSSVAGLANELCQELHEVSWIVALLDQTNEPTTKAQASTQRRAFSIQRAERRLGRVLSTTRVAAQADVLSYRRERTTWPGGSAPLVVQGSPPADERQA